MQNATLASMASEDLFEGAIALITGANKGIGFEIARGLGAKKILVLIGARDEARGKRGCSQAERRGYRRTIRAWPDVTNQQTIDRAARWIEDQFGHLDVLVNNAGIGEWGTKPSDVDLARVREVYDTNLFGPMAMTRAMLPPLRRSKHGRIVNVSSRPGIAGPWRATPSRLYPSSSRWDTTRPKRR